MSNSSQEIVHEGWLTKSPPSKRIWRAKWRRRWFSLRQSGELPGQYYLDYYSDRNCRKLKGRIDLDLCDQVDAGLCMERGGGAVLGSSVRGSVFSVRTAARTYHLQADCEADMQKWVDAICGACGLRAENNCTDTDEEVVQATSGPVPNPDPYIRISECITGVPGQDLTRPRSFTFDAQSVIATNNNHKRVRQGPLGDSSSHKAFVNESPDGNQVNNGPPVPPRPRSTFRLVKNGTLSDKYEGPPIGGKKYTAGRDIPSTVRSGGASQPPPAPPQLRMPSTDGDFHMADETLCYNSSATHYSNMVMMPPAVDRALKPRFGRHGSGHVHNFYHGCEAEWRGDGRWSPTARSRGDYRNFTYMRQEDRHMERTNKLQYLDLDLHPPKASCSKSSPDMPTFHFKSKSASEDPDSAYKTVDFLKTEAFNTTRLDAEASRSNAMAH